MFPVAIFAQDVNTLPKVRFCVFGSTFVAPFSVQSRFVRPIALSVISAPLDIYVRHFFDLEHPVLPLIPNILLILFLIMATLPDISSINTHQAEWPKCRNVT